MSYQLKNNFHTLVEADCKNCFALCCIALPYANSADFAFDKNVGVPCPNLQSDNRCGIHENLRKEGFKGCTVYECFGAGQKVSQITYSGKTWRENPSLAKEMFAVFPVMQQLHEILYFLYEAIHLEDAKPLYKDLLAELEKMEKLTNLSPQSIMELDVPSHRAIVNDLLLRTSELVRARVHSDKDHRERNSLNRRKDFIGANLRRKNLRGANLRGALLIAADLRESDMRVTDFIGADLRDADLRGADLTGSFFLTQVQINSAKGDVHTRLPASLRTPNHWL